MELMQASRQWAMRPEDERFVSLTEMLAAVTDMRRASRASVVSSRSIEAQPNPTDEKGLQVVGPNGGVVFPTHYAFGQLAQRAGAPAGYLRELPPALAADCINVGYLQRDVDEVGMLFRRDEGFNTLNAVTGPNYGRIWNNDVIRALVDRFGDGVTGHFRVPGEFGKRVEVDRQNTTLYASDRDMFVFLADEDRRIEVPNRRNGQPGSLARGFFAWNSEVGDKTFGVAAFLFDYVCCNRIVWGAQGYKEIRIRHTSGAPDRYLYEIAPALERYAASSAQPVIDTIAAAQQQRIDDVAEYLAKRKFTQGQVTGIKLAHMEDEGRPIETVWDAVTGATAYARGLVHQDTRVDIERKAGLMLAA